MREIQVQHERSGSTMQRVITALGVLLAALAIVVPSGARPSAAIVEHPTLVPQNVALGYPIIRSTPQYTTVNGNCPAGCLTPREVMAVAQVGRYIVSGGNFFEVELQDGTVLQQKYFAAWNIDTKQVVCASKFTFNDEVLAFEAGPTATTLYVGGRFSKVTGADGIIRTRARVAMIDLSNCSVNSTFISLGANDKITNIVRNAQRLYVGGDFTTIGGQAIETLAELNATTGAINPAFNFATTGEQVGRIKALALSPDASKLIVAGRFGTMTRNGASVLNPTAIIDISVPSNAALTAHSSTGYVPGVFDLQAASVSPSGDAIGLAYGTATVADYVYVTPTTLAAGTRFRWQKYMRDSSFGIALSNNAAYVTGHFCKPSEGPGATELMAPVMGLDTCTGSVNFTGGVWRSHIAALSLTDGTPLSWNPGQESFNGGKALAVTNRGLLSGFDGERVATIRTGATAFFDFGPQVEDVVAPSDVTFLTPTDAGTVNQPARISGSASDNLAIHSFRVGIRRSADALWLQPDGSFQATYYEFFIKAEIDGSFATQFNLAPGAYLAVARAVDGAGLRSANDATVRFTETGNEGELPASTLVTPPAPVGTGTALTISGTATDNTSVASVKVEVRDDAGNYVQDDGTLGTLVNDLPVTITTGALGSTSASWATTAGSTLPFGDYTVKLTVTDPANNALVVSRVVTIVPTNPVVGWISPSTRLLNDERIRVNATVTDNVMVATAKLRVTNSAGLFLQANGTFAASPKDLPATITGLGTASATVTYDGSLLGIGTYKATVISTDNVGGSTTANRTVTVATTQQIVTNAVTNFTGFTARKSDFVIGYTFRVTAPKTLTALGLFDVNANGINDNPDAVTGGIWRDSDRALLGQTSVRKNTPAEGRWFFGNLATPVVLQPGVTYVVAFVSPRIGEGFGSTGTLTVDPSVQVLNEAYAFGVTFVFPANRGTRPSGVPNMRFVEERLQNPVVGITAPATSVPFGQPLNVASTATDNSQIAAMRVSVANSAGLVLQDDGTLAAGANDLPVTVTGLNTAAASLAGNLGMLPVGSYTITVAATDLGGNVTTVTRALAVAATATKQPPTVISIANRSDVTGTAVSFPVLAADPDGGPVSYAAAQLPAGVSIDAATGRISGTPTAAGATTVIVTVTDDEAAVSSTSFAWQTSLPKVPPIVTTPAARTDRVDDVVSMQLVGSDPDGGTVSFAATPLPAGVSVDATTGLIAGSPTTPGTMTVTVTVTDDESVTTQTTFTWTVLPALAPPTLGALTDRTDPSGTAVTAQLTASDPDGGSVTFAADQLPAGLSLNATTGLISGTPTALGATVVTITVTDDEGSTVQGSFVWTIVAPCVVTPQAAGVLVDWLPIAGVTSYTVRVNAVFLATVTGADVYAHTTGTLANVYTVRYRAGGLNVDIPCING